MELETYTERIAHDQVIVRVSGELDLSTTPEFDAVVRDILSAHPRILIADLSKLTYINSNGMYVLLKAQFRMSQEGGEVVILSARPEVKVTLDLIGVPLRIRCVNSLAEARVQPPLNHSCHSQA